MHRFRKLAGALAAAALAAGLTMAGTGTARADVTPPAGPDLGRDLRPGDQLQRHHPVRR